MISVANAELRVNWRVL